MIYAIEIPHQTPPKAWSFEDTAEMTEWLRTRRGAEDVTWHRMSLEEALEQFVEFGFTMTETCHPDYLYLQSLFKVSEYVVECGIGDRIAFYAEEDAPSEFELLYENAFSDCHWSGMSEDVDRLIGRLPTHQKHRAGIVLECLRMLTDSSEGCLFTRSIGRKSFWKN